MALRALLVDAMGTTVRLLPPWERLDPRLVAGLPPARVEAAFRVEMRHYAAHAHEAVDERSLAALRADCAALLSRELGRVVAVEAMMDAIVFEAYPDARPALAAARGLGLRTICVSNWDHELEHVLARVGLAEELDASVASATAGSRKPDPAIFRRALELAGCAPGEALHVGDGAEDVEGAHAAGIEVLRIDRDGGRGDLVTLAELGPRLSARSPGRPISEHSPR